MIKLIKKIAKYIIDILSDQTKIKLTQHLLKNLNEKNLRYFYSYIIQKLQWNLFICYGENGIFAGSSSDKQLFRKYAESGTWSYEIINRISCKIQFSKRKVTYIDIGANIGLTTIPIAKKYQTVNCIAIEPATLNFQLLCSNIIINDVEKNVLPINKAISSSNGSFTIELSPDNYGDHRLRLATELSLIGENQWLTQKIDAIKLDNLETEADNDLIIKIDVQGAEPLVFEGGKATLNKANLVIFEFSPYQIHRMNLNPNIIIDYVKKSSHVLIKLGDSTEIEKLLDGESAASLLINLYNDNLQNPLGAYWDVIIDREFSINTLY